MPRQIASDDEMPRRRRRRRAANAVAAEAEAEHGFLVRILLRSPKDTIAGLIAFAAVSAIIANALFLQAGRHPAPMFGSLAIPAAALTPANPLPRPRPVEADGTLLEPRPTEIKPAESKATESKATESKASESKASESKASESKAADPKSTDSIAHLVKGTAAAPTASSNVARPPVPVPTVSRGDAGQNIGSRRVAAVQRVLTEYGYGQLKATGTIGSDTQAAIQKFERDHKMPPTGQMSDRLVRELTAMIGHPVD
ncbi:MAG: peptidoglycan-binding protein [Bradyrhizobium sp.]